MIAITGAAGFIGWNIYMKLKDTCEILLVDFPEKFVDEFSTRSRVMHPSTFIDELKNNIFFASKFTTIYHQGACSDTMNHDVDYMMKHNFDFSHQLLHACIENDISLIYASSAAVYGDGITTPFYEDMWCYPKNIYAKSKKLFDDYASEFIENTESQIVGLRYFNVYGPWEHRKGRMSSVINQFHNQINQTGKIKIFKNSDKYLRDFVYVDDITDINLHFGQNPHLSGIFNCGTGLPRAFSDIPRIMSQHYDFEVEEIEMPESLKGKYQEFTQANTTKLIHMGEYRNPPATLEEGIEKYVEFWNQ
jgi:ADP-L-glycero-D-manno-heptose 6-epimerase